MSLEPKSQILWETQIWLETRVGVLRRTVPSYSTWISGKDLGTIVAVLSTCLYSMHSKSLILQSSREDHQGI